MKFLKWLENTFYSSYLRVFALFLVLFCLITTIVSIQQGHFVLIKESQAGVPLRQRIIQHHHTNTQNGGELSLPYYSDSSATNAIDSPTLNVLAGDRGIICGSGTLTYTTAPTYPWGSLFEISGTADVTLDDDIYYVSNYSLTPKDTTNMIGRGCSIFSVGISGTCVFRNIINYTGGVGMSAITTMSIQFIKKL